MQPVRKASLPAGGRDREPSWGAGPMTGDVRAFYAALGVVLPPAQAGVLNATVACFANPRSHRHEDKNRSMSVSTTSGAFNCFACEARGGAYDAALALGKTPADAMVLLERHALVRDSGN